LRDWPQRLKPLGVAYVSARLKACPDERHALLTIVFASERGFGNVKSRSLAALGMTLSHLVRIRGDFAAPGGRDKMGLAVKSICAPPGLAHI
jgi:hypothetical protein